MENPGPSVAAEGLFFVLFLLQPGTRHISLPDKADILDNIAEMLHCASNTKRHKGDGTALPFLKNSTCAFIESNDISVEFRLPPEFEMPYGSRIEDYVTLRESQLF